ncbi:MAG: WD40 repeat domain-containing protein, partial [Gemmataceae bacterium]|nr:WD40 repeat domain-containing protein [Gemmataceae bacterium]
AGLLAGGGGVAAGGAAPLMPHPPDALPPGAVARLGNTRFWHQAESGNPGVNDLAFSPDGRHLAALGLQDSHLSLWDVRSGALVRKWQADEADRGGEVAFSPCGRFLAVGSDDGLRLWDPFAGRLVRVFHTASDHTSTSVQGISFSPDGRHLAAALWRGAIDVYAVTTGERVARLEADPHPLPEAPAWERADVFYTVAFSPDGSRLAAGGSSEVYHDVQGEEAERLQRQLAAKHGHSGSTGWGEKTYVSESRGRLYVWEWPAGRRVAKLDGHEFLVNVARFARDGRLLSAAIDGAVWAWDIGTGRRVDELRPSAGRPHRSAAAVTTDGRFLLDSRPGRLELLDAVTAEPVRAFPVGPGWGGWVNLAVSADARWVAAAAQNGRFRLWDAGTGGELSPPDRHTDWVQAVRFVAAGRQVVTASRGEVMLWDADSGLRVGGVELDGWGRPETFAVSPDGGRAAMSLRRDRGHREPPAESLAVWDWWVAKVREWDVAGVSAAAWLPDGRLALGTTAGVVQWLDPAGGTRGTLLDGPAAVLHLAVSPDGGRLAGLGAGPVVFVSDLPGTGRPRVLPVVVDPPSRQNAWRATGRVTWSPDGRRVAVAFSYGPVCAGPTDAAELPQVFEAPWRNPGGLTELAAAFGPDGRLLAVGSDSDVNEKEYTVRVWDAATERELWASPPQERPVAAFDLSPDGRRLVSGGWDATALVWGIGDPEGVSGRSANLT